MTTAMLRAGWAPVRNLFGRIVRWRHRNGVTVSHELVVTYWRLGTTPPPF